MDHLLPVTAIIAAIMAASISSPAAEVVHLIQTRCQFVDIEPERHFRGASAEQCHAINARSAGERLKEARILRLRAGDYLFRVANRDVPYELGFWLRGAGLSRWHLPSVSGGGIGPGQTQGYAIRLTPGEYRYSCPLNPTPDYVLIVE